MKRILSRIKRTVKKRDRYPRVIAIWLIAAVAMPYTVRAQELQRTIDLEMRGATVEQVITRLKETTGVRFSFLQDDLRNTPMRDYSFHNATLRYVMERLVEGTALEWADHDGTIVISRRTAAMRQPVIIMGSVRDTDGKPLVGVNVIIEATGQGTSTDVNGRFAIPVQTPATNLVLMFSFIGMEKVAVRYTGQTSVDVVMTEAAADIEGVVVTGIFNKARESYTGAATTITARELRMAGNRSLISTIRNIDPSFNIVDNIEIGSDPNKLPTITVRGTSSLPTSIDDIQDVASTTAAQNMPLIILNGFEVGLQRLYDMDENLVESITLLKDASATAMYGTRGSNGVVVITTRMPDSGRLLITYKGDLNVEAPDLTSYNLMNAREKLTFEIASGLYESESAIKTEEVREKLLQRRMNVERGVDTYWLKYPVRTGVGSRHSLGIEGGENTFRYAAGLAFNNVAGAMKGSYRNTLNGNLLFMYKLKNITFKNDFQLSLNSGRNSHYGTFADYSRLNSYLTPYAEDGTVKKVLESFYYSNFGANENVLNPLYNANLHSRNTTGYLSVLNNFSIEWMITRELFVRGQFGISTQRDRSDVYLSAKHTSFDNYTEDDLERKGRYTYGTGNSSRYEGQATVNYAKTLDDRHQLFTGIGVTISQESGESYSVVGEGISMSEMDFLGAARQYIENGRPGGSESIMRAVGVLANVNYMYDNRYFVDLSGKAEGSSQFGADKRMAPFWSVGVGWNLHNEKFFNAGKTVNTLRLRLSYGFTGSQNFPPYLAYTTYNDGGGASYQGGYAVRIMAIGNRDLKWQRTGQYNVGTEMALFDNRVRLNVDVYRKLTDGFLSQVNLPTATGFGSYVANIGEVENKGIEAQASVFVVRNTSGVTWSIGAAAAHNKNTIMKISQSLKALNDQLLTGQKVNPSFLYEEGQSANTIYAVQSLGIDPSNGYEIFRKRNGEETYLWDPRDQVPCGVTDPKVQGTVNTMLRWKGLDLTAYFQFRLGGQAYNYALAGKVENILPYDNADRRALYDRWKTPGEQAKFKSVKDLSLTYATSRFVMDDNTFAFSSISVGYEVPQEWTQRNLAMDYLAMRFYTEDLFYVSTIKRERGLNYPFSRKFSISLTARF